MKMYIKTVPVLGLISLKNKKRRDHFHIHENQAESDLYFISFLLRAWLGDLEEETLWLNSGAPSD